MVKCTYLLAIIVFRRAGCDYCFSSFYFDNHPVSGKNGPTPVSMNTNLGKFQYDYSCLFRNKYSKCPK